VTIADRVRTELGRLEQEHGLERINVDSCDGIVTLRGPARQQSIADALVDAAQKVTGVREVKNELHTEESGEAFVG
jgi:osmotically-inducible protein OsmY